MSQHYFAASASCVTLHTILDFNSASVLNPGETHLPYHCALQRVPMKVYCKNSLQ